MPARFDTDKLDISFEAFRETDGEALFSVRGLTIVELQQTVPIISGVVVIPVVSSITSPPYIPPILISGGTTVGGIGGTGGGTPPPTGGGGGTGTGGGGSGGGSGTGGGSAPPPTTTDRPYILDGSGNVIDTTGLYTALQFQDEFTGSLNTSVWDTNHMNPYGGHNFDAQTYTDGGGIVRTVARLWPLVDGSLPNGGLTPSQFFRRELSTPGSFNMLRGYIEFHAKLLGGRGIFPGLWLFEDGGQREIDLMEAYGNGDGYFSNSSYQITDFTTTCWHVGGGVGDFKFNENNNKAKDLINGGNPLSPITGQFHTWGMHWDNSVLRFNYDGHTYLTVAHNGWYNVPMYPIFQLWFGTASGSGATAGTPTVQDTPQGTNNAFELDWIRVWGLI